MAKSAQTLGSRIRTGFLRIVTKKGMGMQRGETAWVRYFATKCLDGTLSFTKR